LPLLCQKIKKLDFSVKLDTNGTNPKMMMELIDNGLINYVAMDVKAPFTQEKYSKVAGTKNASLLAKIEQTTQTLLAGKVDYEFRTTLVPTLHTIGDIREICEIIKGSRKYVLQNFKADAETIDPNFQKLKPFSNVEMERFFQTARGIIPNTIIRK